MNILTLASSSAANRDISSMNRSKSGMRRPRLLMLLLAATQLLAFAHAGPLGPLPNVTSADVGLKEGSCALGDVVYMSGDEFPGSGPCERCRCAHGGVQCARTRCEPRPGCKALHRPDHCCPTYQCECEQEGRVYGNGEKLVDPADPCRVCYCQGGEVVCRRIACFLRDDCSPRLVPGRCCPEYDNCPLRGVTVVPGVTPSTTTEIIQSSPALPPKEIMKQEITIKEITPVSEIPVIPEVKIKEILPSPSIEVTEYSSSKSPLIVREATSEKPLTQDDALAKNDTPVVIEVQSTLVPMLMPSEVSTEGSESNPDTKATNDSPPSKISFSTQDSINSEIYPSIQSSSPTMGVPSISLNGASTATTKAPVIEEEDPTIFDHNPAFPPLPDDLSVLRNHEDEILPEQIPEEHVSEPQEVVIISDASSSPELDTKTAIPTRKNILNEVPLTTTNAPSTTIKDEKTSTVLINSNDLSTSNYVNTLNNLNTASDFSTAEAMATTKLDSIVGTQSTITRVKDSPMLNIRSAIPTEILNIPSFVPDEITDEVDVDDVIKSIPESVSVPASSFTVEGDKIVKIDDKIIATFQTPTQFKTVPIPTVADPKTVSETESQKVFETVLQKSSSAAIQTPQESTVSLIAKPHVVTEGTLQTELSSLPIETSDQNPKETPEISSKESVITSTESSLSTEEPTTKISKPLESDVITVSSAVPSTDNQSFENFETTEFIFISSGSTESVTDAVELIKISGEQEQSSAIIEPAQSQKNNVLTDLITLVGDVASIGDHTDVPDALRQATSSVTSISESEDLIPVNPGYKSKNSNWNLNSITETSQVKSKSPTVNKQRIVEIEGEDTDTITDSPPPNDKVEPTKIVMKKNNEKPVAEETATEDTFESSEEESVTESRTSTVTAAVAETTEEDESSPAVQ
ncbi:mucin-17 isoform X2 [Hyposmocoma kahamanoa]|uniref:mucin-17 isoform X2 n=1 Tax=Hyposmocoma kahamanoa TaxID=1477025 RepID=UPI000E6D946E|nr:mucin-17 isoform X2 [Hyposmocoma kahamanoa]